MTVAGPAAPRAHIASEEEREDERRLAGMRAHWARRPYGTWGLLAVIGAMFVLEEVLGGSEDSFVLTRLGGQIPGEIWMGAWWRLVSSAFLHAGVMHVAFNSYALWIIGSSIERVVGTARFLVIYTVALLAGSLASLAFSSADLTVGASGAVFGLFGAEAIVVFLRPELLPSKMRQVHARNVLLNLAINLVYSFQPHIATMAHFGGALAGAAIGFFVVPQRFELRPTTPRWASALAALGVLLLAAGLGWALYEATQRTGEVSILQVG